MERGGEQELSALVEKYSDLVLERFKMYSQENLVILGFQYHLAMHRDKNHSAALKLQE